VVVAVTWERTRTVRLVLLFMRFELHASAGRAVRLVLLCMRFELRLRPCVPRCPVALPRRADVRVADAVNADLNSLPASL
jgi:hypothetical protein